MEAMAEKRKELITIGVLTVLLCAIAAVLYRDLLFGPYVYIYRDAGSDTFNSYWPTIEYLIRRMQSGDMTWWSFQTGLGTSVVNLVHCIADPFTLVLLLFPKNTMAYGLIWVMVLKILVTGVCFYLYAREIGLQRGWAVAGSLIVSFCGYFVLWGQHYYFATIFPMFSLLLLAEARLRHKKGGKLFVLAVWFQLVGYIYTAALSLIGLVLIVFLEYILEEKKSVGGFFRYIWNYVWRGLIATGLAAFRLIPSIYYLMDSSRMSRSTVDAQAGFLLGKRELLDTMLRIFSNNSLGVTLGENALGYNYYEQIMLATSVLSLIFFFHNVIVRRGRERIFCIVCGAVTIASLCTRGMCLLTGGGKGDNWRWTFWLVYLFAVNVAFALQDVCQNMERRVRLLTVEFCVTVALFVAAFLVFLSRYYPVLSEEEWNTIRHVIQMTAVVIVLYAGSFLIFYHLKKMSGLKEAAVGGFTVSILMILCMELVIINFPSINDRIYMWKNSIYSSEYYAKGNTDAIAWIKGQDDGLYRIEKNYIAGLGNDPLLMDYYGTSAYALMGSDIYNFYARYNLAGFAGETMAAVNMYPELESLLGIKYMIANQDFTQPYYEDIGAINEESHIYRNEFAFPIIYTADEETATEIEQIVNGDFSNITELYDRVSAAEITSFAEDDIRGIVRGSGQGKLITSIPYDKGWQLWVDGSRVDTEIVNIGFLGASLARGEHTICLTYFPYGMKAGIIISAVLFFVVGVVYRGRRESRINKVLATNREWTLPTGRGDISGESLDRNRQ